MNKIAAILNVQDDDGHTAAQVTLWQDGSLLSLGDHSAAVDAIALFIRGLARDPIAAELPIEEHPDFEALAARYQHQGPRGFTKFLKVL